MLKTDVLQCGMMGIKGDRKNAMTTYQDIRSQVEHLTPDEQLRLLEALAVMVRRHIAPTPKLSVMELEGLGKDTWQGIDAQEYVNQERDSWNG